MSTGELGPILTAIGNVRDECGHIEKDGYNEFHKYKFVSEAAFSRAIRPLLAKHGLVILQSVALDPPPRIDEKGVTHMVLEFTLAHAPSGTVWPERLRVFCSGDDHNKNGWGDKGAYKANTGGYKYFLNRLFMVDTGNDPDAQRAAKPATSGSAKAAKPKPASATKPSAPLPGTISDKQRALIWSKAGTIVGTMMETASTDVLRDATLELITVAKAAHGIESANDLLASELDQFLETLNHATMDEDGRIGLSNLPARKEATR